MIGASFIDSNFWGGLNMSPKEATSSPRGSNSCRIFPPCGPRTTRSSVPGQPVEVIVKPA